jgi:hypothetical protein
LADGTIESPAIAWFKAMVEQIATRLMNARRVSSRKTVAAIRLDLTGTARQAGGEIELWI